MTAAMAMTLSAVGWMIEVSLASPVSPWMNSLIPFHWSAAVKLKPRSGAVSVSCTSLPVMPLGMNMR